MAEVRNGVLVWNGAEVEVVMPVHTLLRRLVAGPRAARLLLANNIFV